MGAGREAEHPIEEKYPDGDVDNAPCAKGGDNPDVENGVGEVIEHDERGDGKHESRGEVGEPFPFFGGDVKK